MRALEFHHTDPKEKDFGISTCLTKNIEELKIEVDKCILVCSNCHAELHEQIDTNNFNPVFNEMPATFVPQQQHFCELCGTPITNRATYCPDCRSIAIRRSLGNENASVINYPDRDTLKILIRSKSFVEIGKQFNVSGNAIKKWCVKNNLPNRKIEITSYTDDEWEKI